MSNSYKRRCYFIEKQFQAKYIVLTIILLLIYTALFVVLLFLPYIIPLEFGASIDDQAKAARMLLALHKSVWPAIGLVIIIMGGLSVFITHKIVGPVYRFKKALAEISAGNLDVTIKLRKHDDLQDLAADINLVAEELREFVQTLKSDYQTMSDCIRQLEVQILDKSVNEVSGRELVDRMQASKDNIAKALGKYSLR